MNIEELKAAYYAATPEEWRLEDGTEPGGHKLIVDVQDVSIARCYQQPLDTWLASDNAKFIALAHNAMPALLEAVDLVLAVSYGNTDFEELERHAHAILAKLEEECDGDGASGHMELKKLYALWDHLGNIPTNDADEIEEVFLHFGVGTHRVKIWHWFEAQNPRFLVGEIMSGRRESITIGDLMKSLPHFADVYVESEILDMSVDCECGKDCVKVLVEGNRLAELCAAERSAIAKAVAKQVRVLYFG